MAIKRLYDTLVGATVGWNQILNNGNFATENGWNAVNAAFAIANNEATAIATARGGQIRRGTGIMLTSGHKYVAFGQMYGASTKYVQLGSYPRSTASVEGVWVDAYTFVNATETAYVNVAFGDNASSDWQEFKVRNAGCIDLTAMFGSTIADYLYNLETATAGAGVAKLKECGFLAGGYIPYNVGTLESVEARSHVMRGFNQWDEEWELGRYAWGNGLPVADSTRIRSKNYIQISWNTIYYARTPDNDFVDVYFYDKDKKFISPVVVASVRTFTSPSDAKYMRISIYATYGNTYNHDICINLSNPDRNGEYEPYHEYTYDLGTDTLRGLFKLDSNNNLYADGDRKTSDGTVTRKYGVVDLGTLNWTESSGLWSSSPIANMPTIKAVICSRYVYAGTFSSNAELTNIADKSIGCHTSVADKIFIKDAAYTDAASFKAAMSGVMLVYELATPTTEQSAPFQNPQICDPDGTEEYTTNNGVPVGHETRYQL